MIQAVMTAKKVAAMMGMERCIEPRHSSRACVIQLAPAGLSHLVDSLVWYWVFDRYNCKTPTTQAERQMHSFVMGPADGPHCYCYHCYCYLINNKLGEQTVVLLVCFMSTCMHVVDRCKM